MKVWIGFASLFLASYLVFLAIQAPAAHVLAALGDSLQPISFHWVDGRLLSGRAGEVRVANAHLGRVAWRLQPFAVLEGCLAFKVSLVSEGGGKADGAVASCVTGKKSVKNLTVATSLAETRPLGILNALQTAGDLEMHLDSLEMVGDGFHNVAGEAAWREASVELGRLMELGIVSAELRASDGWLLADVRSEDGEVTMQGAVRLAAGGDYVLDLTLVPVTDEAAELLSGFVRPDRNGTYPLKLAGTLP